MWEMFSYGKTPYPGLSNAEVVEKVLAGYRMPSPSGCLDIVYDIMMSCWDAKPENRPTFAEVAAKINQLCVKEETKFTSTPIPSVSSNYAVHTNLQ